MNHLETKILGPKNIKLKPLEGKLVLSCRVFIMSGASGFDFVICLDLVSRPESRGNRNEIC